MTKFILSKALVKKIKKDRDILWDAYNREPHPDVKKTLYSCFKIIQMITNNSMGISWIHKK